MNAVDPEGCTLREVVNKSKKFLVPPCLGEALRLGIIVLWLFREIQNNKMVFELGRI
jgi:hypothetical protein